MIREDIDNDRECRTREEERVMAIVVRGPKTGF
jgi:hypothetical protein